MGSVRFILAMAVVASHSSTLFGIELAGGRISVQGFYIISGFLITLMLTEKYGTGVRDLWLFYSNRALRIWVPYAVVAVATVLLLKLAPLLGGNTVGGAAVIGSWKALSKLDLVTAVAVLVANLSLIGTDIGMLFAHRAGEGLVFTANFHLEARPFYEFYILPQTWTLGLELSFYAVAPFLVRRHPAVIVVMLGLSVATRLWAYGNGFTNDPWNYRFFPFELALFLTGALAAKAYGQIGRAAWSQTGWARAGALVGVLPLILQPYARLPEPLMFALFAGALPVLFLWTKGMAVDRRLGDLSYPLYLVHFTVLLVIQSLPQLDAPVAHSGHVVVPLSIAVAMLVAAKVEVPLDAFRRKRLSPT